MPRGVYTRKPEQQLAKKATWAKKKQTQTPDQLKAQQDQMAHARAIGAVQPRTKAQMESLEKAWLCWMRLHPKKEAVLFNPYAEESRRMLLDQARQTILDQETELAKLVADQLKDEQSYQWGSSKTLSLDAPYGTENDSMYEWIATISDKQQYEDERLLSLIGY